jgi:hypothetical protein
VRQIHPRLIFIQERIHKQKIPAESFVWFLFLCLFRNQPASHSTYTQLLLSGGKMKIKRKLTFTYKPRDQQRLSKKQALLNALESEIKHGSSLVALYASSTRSRRCNVRRPRYLALEVDNVCKVRSCIRRQGHASLGALCAPWTCSAAGSKPRWNRDGTRQVLANGRLPGLLGKPGKRPL